MAKLTRSKADKATGHVYVVEYGFDLDFAKRNAQAPYLSVTGEHWTGTPMRRTERNLVSMGCLHDMVREQFPELAALIPFHLHSAPSGEPMYYIENATHWHDHVTGAIRRNSWHDPKRDTPELGRKHFLEHVCADVPGVGPVPDEVFTFDRDTLKRWLADRLPAIRSAMMAACKDAGVNWPEVA